jgi:aminomethyltransferase
MTTPLMKQSPLAGCYQDYNAQTVEIAGWQMPENFGSVQKEKSAFENASVVLDFSHIGKISVRGEEAAELFPEAKTLESLQVFSNESIAILRLTDDELIILTPSGQQNTVLGKCQGSQSSVIDMSGALGCLTLAGPRRDEVIERSTAMNLCRNRVDAGSVIQTTIHAVPTTLWRTKTLDVILVSRDFTEFLFDALLDVGQSVGLTPAGLATLASPFTTGQ